MLSLDDVHIEIGARVLLRGATVRIRSGEKVALVGPNGAGKTTLLRAIAGEAAMAGGKVGLPPRVGYLRQEGKGAHGTGANGTGARGELAIDHLVEASPLAKMKHELEEL